MPSLVGTTVATNYLKNVRANGLGPRTVIVKIAKTNLTNDELNTIINAITSSQGSGDPRTGDSAFVVAGLSSDQSVTTAGITQTNQFVSGTSDVVFLALQGTGVITADGSDAYGVSGAVTTVEAVFDQQYNT
jgi:hypothetical protein